MAQAEYFDRAALAAAQVLDGFDPDAFAEKLASTRVGIAFAPASEGSEAASALDLLLRLLARLYPALDISCPGAPNQVAPLAALGRSINPRLAVTSAGIADVGVVVGDVVPRFDTPIFVGAVGWDSYLSIRNPQPIGHSGNPLGAGVAACAAAANVFRRVFMADWPSLLDSDFVFSTYSFERGKTSGVDPNPVWSMPGELALGGVGAIGMAAVWALARLRFSGTIRLVDHERIDLSNLQRYVLAERRDVGRPKARVAAQALRSADLRAITHPVTWRSFVSRHGYRIPFGLAAFDSADARREMQASLPAWIANAWTQPGDLGVSVHPRFGSEGACVACLYLPDHPIRNEDELVAAALGVPGRVAEIRTLLHLSQPVPAPLLAEIGDALGVDADRILAFRETPIRDLYVRGICGGALIPLGRAGRPEQGVHVPLAHQSALAGVLLAARLAQVAAGPADAATSVARINIQRPWPDITEQRALKRGDGRCICEDADYVQSYMGKYGLSSEAAASVSMPTPVSTRHRRPPHRAAH